MTGSFRLLIVEDNAADAELVLRSLRRAGLTIEEFRVVDHPDTLRDALADSLWDAVLSDFNLPGFDALRSLEILRESGRRIPFLLVSGAVGEERAAEAVRCGAAGFVSKGHLDRLPLTLLRAVVEAAAERREEAARRAAEQAIAEQKHLLSIVSHDVRAPLQAFRFGLERARKLVERGDDREALSDCFEQLAAATERMGRLIDDVLDYSKLDAGCFEIQRKTDDLRSVAWAMAEEAGVLAAPRGIRVVLDVPQRPVEVAFDRKRLEQVFGNLLSNAVKYSPPGGTITVRILEEEEHVHGEVLDEGSGIAGEDLPHLFERYWQSTRSRDGGVGLGLYIVERLVSLHGGRVWAENRPEGGTAFRFALPKGEASEDRDGLRAGALVAVVDDDDFSREILRGLLLDEGFRVVDWPSGQAALADLRRSSRVPEAAVVDARLPDLPGTELALALRSGTEFPAVERVVLTSADPSAGTKAPPGIRFLRKPIDLELLLGELRQAPSSSLLRPPAPGTEASVPER